VSAAYAFVERVPQKLAFLTLATLPLLRERVGHTRLEPLNSQKG
jgi:hypothetical protein